MFFAGVIVHVPHINDGGKIIERSSFLRRFVSSYLLTTEHLPRQARDKHIRENSTKTFCLLLHVAGDIFNRALAAFLLGAYDGYGFGIGFQYECRHGGWLDTDKYAHILNQKLVRKS